MPHLMLVGIGIWSAILGGGSYFAWRFVRVLERRRDNDAALSALTERLAALEDSLEAMSSTVERLEAGQAFTARLLESRSGSGDAAVRGSKSIARKDTDSLARG